MLNISFQVTDAAKTAAILAILQGPDGAAETAEPTQPRAERKKKEETKADAMPDPASVAETSAPAPAEEKKETAAELRSRITPKVVALVQTDREKVKKALEKFGAAGFGKLPDDKLGDFEKELFG